MIKRLRTILISASLLLGVAAVPLLAAPATVSAVDPCNNPKDCLTKGKDATVNNPGTQPTLQDRIKTITNILMFVLGAIAVIVIVIGGIRYATSGGDQTQVTSAKNTILYAVVGIVVAILAYAIVNFVVDQF